MTIRFVSFGLNPEFVMLEGNKIVSYIKVHSRTGAFRIKCHNTMRVFFINKEVIKNKPLVTLTNEYDQQLGFIAKSLLYENSGEIEVEGLSCSYNIDSSLKEINLFARYDHNQVLLNCNVEVNDNQFSIDTFINYILFSSIWFIYLSKEKVASQFANSFF